MYSLYSGGLKAGFVSELLWKTCTETCAINYVIKDVDQRPVMVATGSRMLFIEQISSPVVAAVTCFPFVPLLPLSVSPKWQEELRSRCTECRQRGCNNSDELLIGIALLCIYVQRHASIPRVTSPFANSSLITSHGCPLCLSCLHRSYGSRCFSVRKICKERCSHYDEFILEICISTPERHAPKGFLEGCIFDGATRP